MNKSNYIQINADIFNKNNFDFSGLLVTFQFALIHNIFYLKVESLYSLISWLFVERRTLRRRKLFLYDRQCKL